MPKIRSMLLGLATLFLAALSFSQVVISVRFGPPPLPVYEQPYCPGDDYIWVPGYWAWNPVGYYWVPGTWVQAPEPGLLWTPGYWAFNEGAYFWHAGYWGPVVGYYGGIDYGFGYPGNGYGGGYWRDRHFYYNRAVNRVNVTNVRYVYNTTIVNNVTTVNRVSYNGGPGGTSARPNAEQEAAARQRRVAETKDQQRHEEAAREDRNLRASVNEGRPPVAATAKPAELNGKGVTQARQTGTPYRPPADRADDQQNAPREDRDKPRQNTPPQKPDQPDRRPDQDRRTPPETPEPRANPSKPNQEKPQATPPRQRPDDDRPKEDQRNTEQQKPDKRTQQPGKPPRPDNRKPDKKTPPPEEEQRPH